MKSFTPKLLAQAAGFALALSSPLAASAQAPAGAPAGANGICKDGTYSTAASKDGACRGHKGVQTWYSATPSARKGSTAAPTSPQTRPASPAPAPQPQATQTPAPGTRGAAPVPASVTQQQAPAPPAARPQQPASPQPQVAPAATKGNISAERAKLSTMQPAAGGGPGLVWVNGSSKVYHCSGSEFYGKTKTGSYMSESDAKAKGAHADHNKPCS